MKSLKIGFVILFLLLGQAQSFGSGTCEGIFTHKSAWVGKNKNYYMALRSNAYHFWNWFALKSNLFLDDGLLVVGNVIGDAHFGNLSVVRGNQKMFFGLVDKDDGGRGYLVGDFIQYMVRVKASPSQVKIKEMTKEYFRGLQGKEMEMPKFLSDLIELNEKKFEALQEKKLNKSVDAQTEKLITDEELSAIKDSSKAIQLQWSMDKSILNQILGRIKIADVATYAKDRGGSRGMLRFILYAKNKNQKSLFQAKELAVPAVAIVEKQKSHRERIESLEKDYNDNQSDFVTVAEGSGKSYIVTPKYKIEYDPTKLTLKETNELSLYIANWMGVKQAKQRAAKPLIHYIKENKERSLDQIAKATKAYIELSKETYKAHD